MCLFFFFKQKTAYEMRISDWSSDVCSSDLLTSAARSAASVSGFDGHRRVDGVGMAARAALMMPPQQSGANAECCRGGGQHQRIGADGGGDHAGDDRVQAEADECLQRGCGTALTRVHVEYQQGDDREW